MRLQSILLILSLANEVSAVSEVNLLLERDRSLCPRGYKKKGKSKASTKDPSKIPPKQNQPLASNLNTASTTSPVSDTLPILVHNRESNKPSGSSSIKGKQSASRLGEHLQWFSDSSISSGDEGNPKARSPRSRQTIEAASSPGTDITSTMSRLSLKTKTISNPSSHQGKQVEGRVIGVGPAQLEAEIPEMPVKLQSLPEGTILRWPNIKTDQSITVGGVADDGHIRAKAKGNGLKFKIQTGPNGNGFYQDRRRKGEQDSKALIGPNKNIEGVAYGAQGKMARMMVGVDGEGSAHLFAVKGSSEESVRRRLKETNWAWTDSGET